MPTITGTSGNDTLAGDRDLLFKDDVIEGLEGRDTLSGLTGNDQIFGGPDNDRLLGGSGDDELRGEAGDDLLQGSTGSDTLLGGPGNDLLFLFGAPGLVARGDSARGGTGDDRYSFSDLRSNPQETLGHDIVEGSGAGIDTIFTALPHFGLDANVENIVLMQLLETGQLVDPVNGAFALGNGLANRMEGNSGNNAFTGDGGDDTLLGNAGDDALSGDAGNDTLRGAAGGDDLSGGGDNDRLEGGPGADDLDGGTGNDTYVMTDALNDQNDTIVDVGGLDTVESAFGWSLAFDSPAVENLTLTGTAAINGLGSSAANTILGNAAANTLTGGGDNDVLRGQGGDDTLSGGSNRDTLEGGSGNDSVSDTGGGDDVFVFTRLSLLSGASRGSDRFSDTAGVDSVLLSSLSEVASAERVGNDMVVQMTDSPLVSTDGGTFRVIGHFAGQTIEAVRDTSGAAVTLAVGLVGGNAAGIIAGSDADETLDGRGGDDQLHGNGGSDRVLGGAGDDSLWGGDGDDVLKGGPGDDRYSGGAGADRFRISRDSRDATILDFEQADTLDLRPLKLGDAEKLLADAEVNGKGLLLDLGKGSVFLQGMGLGDLDPAQLLV